MIEKKKKNRVRLRALLLCFVAIGFLSMGNFSLGAWPDDGWTVNAYAIGVDSVTDTQKADLNGDGQMETITAEFMDVNDETGEGGTCTLKVGEKTFVLPGYCFDPKIYLVDIDKADNQMEFAITDNGPSSDYLTHFYSFDTDLREMGSMQGAMGGAGDYVEAYGNKNLVDTVEGSLDGAIKAVGDGSVIGTSRGSLFQTWIRYDEYQLNGAHRLILQKKSFYEAVWKNRITAKKAVIVYGNDKKKVIAKLKKGEKVIFYGSDEKKFCKIKLKNGKFGWIKSAPNKIDTSQFDGLFIAD